MRIRITQTQVSVIEIPSECLPAPLDVDGSVNPDFSHAVSDYLYDRELWDSLENGEQVTDFRAEEVVRE